MPRKTKAKTQNQRVADGARAFDLMKLPVYRDAVDSVREDLTNQWRRSGEDENVKREHLWACLQALELVQQKLDAVMSDGTIARKEIERLNK